MSEPIVNSEDLPVEDPVSGIRRPSFAFAKRHGILVELNDEQQLVVRHRPDLSLTILSELRRTLGQPFQLQEVPAEEFNTLLTQAYEQDSSQTMLAMEDLGEDNDLFSIADQLPEPEDLLDAEDDAPIIKLINAILTEAIKEDASDVHIETYENRLVVRFRVDGVLREVLQPQRVLAPLIVSRIKVMARMDIAEKRVPQDGRISLRVAGRAVDVRVSTLPSGHGERVVLRLLDKQAGRMHLEHLGMDRDTEALMDKLVHKPHGILLVTGPTGSGKTTTLYAALTKLNERTRNILTVEDPIEYYLDGVGQTQVNTKVDMSFARGLRAILRQDPDVVMVGEIRDLETAEIAVQASLTGHLVLSTLHTNSAVGAVTRLRDMGVEPFLLSSSLIGVLAQRLVRVLCKHCKQPYEPNEKDREVLGIAPDQSVTLYRAVGCESCNQLGYQGRTGIYELIEIDDRMAQMVHDGAGEIEMEAYARTRTPSLRQDGVRNILAGITSLDEVLRVTRED